MPLLLYFFEFFLDAGWCGHFFVYLIQTIINMISGITIQIYLDVATLGGCVSIFLSG